LASYWQNLSVLTAPTLRPHGLCSSERKKRGKKMKKRKRKGKKGEKKRENPRKPKKKERKKKEKKKRKKKEKKKKERKKKKITKKEKKKKNPWTNSFIRGMRESMAGEIPRMWQERSRGSGRLEAGRSDQGSAMLSNFAALGRLNST